MRQFRMAKSKDVDVERQSAILVLAIVALLDLYYRLRA